MRDAMITVLRLLAALKEHAALVLLAVWVAIDLAFVTLLYRRVAREEDASTPMPEQLDDLSRFRARAEEQSRMGNHS